MEFNVCVNTKHEFEKICEMIAKKNKTYDNIRFNETFKDNQVLIWKDTEIREVFNLIERYNFKKVYILYHMHHKDEVMVLKALSNYLVNYKLINLKYNNSVVVMHDLNYGIDELIKCNIPDSSTNVVDSDNDDILNFWNFDDLKWKV